MNLPAGGSPDHGPGRGEPARPAAPDAHRRRLDEVFGDVLPDVTGDERDVTGDERGVTADGRGAGDERGAGGADDDRWYLENRPPHHG